MAEQTQSNLSRRERQIMDVIYRMEKATAVDVMEKIPDPPSYSAVRAMLRVLEEKGHLKHEQDGPRYVFSPVVARDTARRSAMKHLVRTFFDGSTESAVAALLMNESKLSRPELERLSGLIEKAKTEGR
jgi:BlaI family transcriptional regulator, penicillinase repressor